MRKLSCIFVTAIFASLPSLAFAAGAIDGGTKQAVNWVAIGMFVAFVALTLGITYWAAKQTASAADFYSAGGGITGFQNGLAIAGDYMSAASFLGISGLVYTSGYDGLIYSVGWLVGWPIVTFLIAEQLRNLGKFTFADVTSFRLGQTEIRILAACGSLVTVAFYLIAQMVGAGKLIQLLFGLDYWMAVVLVGGLMMVYVTFGGMKATTWVQIIKAVLLLMGATFMAGAVLYKFGFSPEALFAKATEVHPKHTAIMEPGSLISNPLSAISLGLALMFGTAGLPHILMRFFTVPDAKAARSSVVWAVGLIGVFYVMTTFLGFGARAFLGTGGEEAAGAGGNLAAPLLAEELGGGAGTVGGDLFLAIIAAVAFATILAVVAGLVISASGAVAHDVWSSIVRKGKDSEHEEVYVARIAAGVIGAATIAIAVNGGEGLNVSFMVGLAFAVAASANFPALLLSLTWRRFNTTGAVTGVLVGTFSSIFLVIVSPGVWPGPDAEGSPIGWELANPGIVSIPLGFIGCWLGTVLSKEETRADRDFDELYVRSETGLGAEVATGRGLMDRPADREPAPPPPARTAGTR